MMSQIHPENLSSRRMLMVAVLILATGPLSACSTVQKGWKSTKEAVTGLFGSDDKASPPPDTATADSSAPAPATTGVTGIFTSGTSTGAFASTSNLPPSLSSVPTTVPTPPSSAEQRAQAVEGLIADRAKADYTEQGGRREPVTVRPLNETTSTPSDVAANGAPPRPQAAPAQQVTRLENVPPRTTALAERLGAAPPPAPAGASGEAMPSPTPSPTPAPTALRASGSAPSVPRAPVQRLVPQNSYIADYSDDTIVIDSSGVRGRNNARGTQLAGLPSAGFDPGNSSVSSEVGTISFSQGSAALSADAKAILADVARLRAQMDGAIRIVGRGNQAAARASAISRELRRLGVPATRLYDGGADRTMLGDEADIYLDY
ncbi:MAG: hypothetical protein EXR11_12915 [Rhodospirillaceae bacterium]|nr:hypothetical protein [Rhodospirillaceae bacterium]